MKKRTEDEFKGQRGREKRQKVNLTDREVEKYTSSKGTHRETKLEIT